MKKILSLLLGGFCAVAVAARQPDLPQSAAAPGDGVPAIPEATIRPDGRSLDSRAVAQALLDRRPVLAFDPDCSRREFIRWKRVVRRAVAELVRHPRVADRPAAQLVSEVPRDGYRLQKWECYPLDGCAVRFLVLIPNGLSGPVPAVLCIPGSGQTKELMAGEAEVEAVFTLPASEARNDMARQFVRAGWVAVAVDNPCAGECSDLERFAPKYRGYDYDDTSRVLLEAGWSYQGYASFVDRQVLEWMKTHPAIRRDRIVVSGFSLGTETLMLLGALDSGIFAFVYNDFLCNTRERALAMTLPGTDGRRHFPNSIRHLIPGMLARFDFPDLVAALAPRPVICTEGGLDRDFRLVERAYALAGNPEGCRCLHQPRFADSADRQAVDRVPRGIARDDFFRLANVDPKNHYFKGEQIIPWLKNLLENTP